MANIQTQFSAFDATIRLGRFEENANLRDKRDIIRRKLTNNLPRVFEEAGETCPQYHFRDQGSYEMGTGIVPLKGDYDIDQGLYFEVKNEDYPDPLTLKKRVYSALEGHTDNVCIRRSCVTVFYHLEEEPIYHVDIAVYTDGTCNNDGISYIAKGKENSGDEYRIWEPSNPQALIDLIHNRFEGNDRSQFRRIVRYLKRWKDHKFTLVGNAAPIGIGLTVAAFDDLQNCYLDPVAEKPDDLRALINLISKILRRFTTTWNPETQTWVRRLSVKMPVEPWNDLFVKMTDKQMIDFEAKLQSLQEHLEGARDEVDPVEACSALRKVFGEDFSIPSTDETAKKHQRAIVSSSNSAWKK